MGDIHFITYGDDKFAAAKQRLSGQAMSLNIFKSITAYGQDDMDFYFVIKHFNTLIEKRGGGYWLWKIYFIMKKLSEINNNDYLIYCDAGCNINNNGKMRINEYLMMVTNSNYGIMTFQMGQPEEHYTSQKIFNAFGVLPDSPIRKSGQYGTTILVMRKCEHVLRSFVKCIEIIDNDQKLITDYYNNTDRIPDFIDNRHDQSILSVLFKIYGSVVVPEETWYPDFNCPEARSIPFLATRQRHS